MQSTEDLSSAVSETEEWADDLKKRLGWHDRHKLYAAMLGALHALRDSLTKDEAVHLGNALPALLRGLYYEGWHPSPRPAASRSDFLDRVHACVHHDPGIDPEQVARAVLALLAARLPAAELETATAATPQPLRGLWPD